MSKYSVNDYVTAKHTNLIDDCQYSFGQILSVENNKYSIKLVGGQEIQCEVLIIDTITDIVPTKSKMMLENPFEMYDFVEDSSSYHYFCEIQKNPKNFIDNKMKIESDIVKVRLVSGRDEKLHTVSHVIVTPILTEKPSVSPAPTTVYRNPPPQVWISKCRHGEECERLGCPKGPKYCPHGEGCERLMCKGLY
jgi:hypothetical protein